MKVSQKYNWAFPNRLFSWFNILPILFLVFTLLFSFFSYKSLEQLQIASKNRYQSYLLSEQLRLSSDQLTLMARAYAATGNKKYLNYFNDILAIRNGEKHRPEHYQWVYWDMLMPENGQAPFESGKKESLNSLMKKRGFTAQELNLLVQAHQYSDELTAIEFKAFKIIQTIVANNPSYDAEVNSAVELLFSDNYLKAKAQIMTYINEFYQLQEKRTSREVELISNRHNVTISLTIFGFLGIILSLLYNAYVREHLNKNFIEILKAEVDKQTLKLADKNSQLETIICQMELAQAQLVESEKMASLGNLVSGVAHEVNTPLGICITLASYLDDEIKRLAKKTGETKLTHNDLTHFIDSSKDSCSLLLNNARRAAELIANFKEIAVDQSIEEKRDFKLGEYIRQVLRNLQPKLKKTQISITTYFPEQEKEIFSYPGVFSQIITNLIMNAYYHAFDNGSCQGNISISIKQTEKITEIMFEDNGCGMTEDTRKKIFQPFFTTKRGAGGSGLGMSIVYNLVCHKLKGSISCHSTLNKGTKIIIVLPKQ